MARLSEYRALVADGAYLLDRRAAGWRALLRPADLKMASTGECVLGQLFGDFYAGCEALDMPVWSAMRMGFMVDNPGEEATAADAWRQELVDGDLNIIVTDFLGPLAHVDWDVSAICSALERAERVSDLADVVGKYAK